MSGVKNQHYVPRFYLRSFTDDSGYLSVVRRDAGVLKPVFRPKPEGSVEKVGVRALAAPVSDIRNQLIS